MHVTNLKLSKGGCWRARENRTVEREREEGIEAEGNASGIEKITKQNRGRDSKTVELILLFNIVKLVSLAVQRHILPFLLVPRMGKPKAG